MCLCKIRLIRGHILTQVLLNQKGEKMKKIAIVGASLALAAMPLAGVFATADSTVTDVLTVTVQKSCTLTHSGEAATGASYNNGTYSRTMAANELKDLGTSSFTVNCNDTAGYTVTGTFGTLTSENSDTITYKNSAAAANDGKWSALITDGSSSYVASGATVRESDAETSVAGDTFTVKYSVGTKNDQPFGIYTNASAAVYELTGKTTGV